MKKYSLILVAIALALCFVFASCAPVVEQVVPSETTKQPTATTPSQDVEDILSANTQQNTVEQTPSKRPQEKKDYSPKGEYNKGVVLVKNKDGVKNSTLTGIFYKSVEQLYAGSSWYKITLKDNQDTEEAVKALASTEHFEEVDYDYVMKADGTEVESYDISGNTYAEDLTYLETLGVKKGWEHNANNKKQPGGSPDVIIAVIDTGVDYNHQDLRNNIWTNPGEIPDNGIDDDNNGYIDDVRGWDCVGNDNDPMDDNGHGTHVAGIAAAENNKLGTVGIAYNCKIMPIKAGSSSGYFNSSDIAEAVQYAYMNGASVINMSFGGTSIARATEEALKDAYNQCVLVAAAGNSGMCNQPGCPVHYPVCAPFYPASLTYVIGVMSCDASGSYLSSFSNYDHYPYNNYEYDVVACGENIQSTWPNNKYASLSGTSMASPTVAGIAAVLRSTFSDRETYSSKFITAQIVSTVSRENNLGIANLHSALTEAPKPYIYNIYDQYIFDNVEFSPKNNGNGVIDAGETIRLAVELQNRGGVATNVVAKLDTIRNNDPDLTDPYFTITQDTIHFSDIGTYSVRDCGKLYDEDGNLVGTEKYFEFIVADNCPNSYLVDFNLRLSYENGLDETDNTVYTGTGSVLCNVNRGHHLSGTISEDTVFEADRLYIVSSDVVIPEGVTVTFKEGCEIQFYDNREYYNSPSITVYGTLNFEGTTENLVKIHPDDHHETFRCYINNHGTLNMSYVDTINLYILHQGNSSTDDFVTNIYSSFLRINPNIGLGLTYAYSSSSIVSRHETSVASNIENCYVELMGLGYGMAVNNMDGCFITINSFADPMILIKSEATNNVFYSYYSVFQELHTNIDSKYMFGDPNQGNCIVENNIFYSEDDHNPSTLVRISRHYSGSFGIFKNNIFSNGYKEYAPQVIEGYYGTTGNPILDVYGSLADASILWPYVVNVEMFNKDGNPITTVGKEEITVRVTFNRAMDTTQDTFVSFGTVVPYDDYRINGEWISDTVWEGIYTLKAQIENGTNFLKVNNACAKEDPTLTVFGEYQLHEFTIDTTAAMSMNLLATAKENGIELTFAQDDYDTLLGYNIYRSTEKDGNFVRINPTIIPEGETTFVDENAEPGVKYWYTYTVVLTDFTESNPAGKVVCTALDTLLPNIYHTPVNQGYMNNNLVISATATDNVAVANVTLYYRTVGSTEWKTLTMLKQNDKYSATIFGSELSLAGLEYYIVASDGVGSIEKGSATAPYTVVIKDASAISRKGDVDGDGVVTAKDALMLMQCINGDLLLTDDEFKRADLNSDGVLNSMEALRILQYINGNVNTLEM